MTSHTNHFPQSSNNDNDIIAKSDIKKVPNIYLSYHRHQFSFLPHVYFLFLPSSLFSCGSTNTVPSMGDVQKQTPGWKGCRVNNFWYCNILPLSCLFFSLCIARFGSSSQSSFFTIFLFFFIFPFHLLFTDIYFDSLTVL